MISKSQKARAQKVIPGGTKKKDSSAKSLNDIKKSILRFRSNRTMDRIHGSDPWIQSIGSKDRIHGSDHGSGPWIGSVDSIHGSNAHVWIGSMDPTHKMVTEPTVCLPKIWATACLESDHQMCWLPAKEGGLNQLKILK